jgi:intraflagellar transport protein 80
MALFCRQVRLKRHPAASPLLHPPPPLSQTEEAEAILQSAGLFYRLIDMHCSLFNWDRALDIAIKQKTHVDTVLSRRRVRGYCAGRFSPNTFTAPSRHPSLHDQRHLVTMGGAEETKPLFIQYGATVDIDEEAIAAKIAAEAEAERSRPGARPFA